MYFKKEGGKNSGSIYLRGCPVRLDPEDPAVILIQTGGFATNEEGGGNAGIDTRLTLVCACVWLISFCSSITEERLWMLRATSAMEAARWKEDLDFYSS